MSLNTGELTKVTILAFDKKDMQGKESGKFTLPINPENYSRSLSVELDDTKGQGTAGTDAKSKGTKPEEIKLDFYFDSTGTVQGYKMDGYKFPPLKPDEKNEDKKIKPIHEQVNHFLEVVYFFKDKIHQPRFLKLCWADFVFRCKLKDLSINYTLFAPSGEPLRAKLSGTFQSFVEPDLRVILENKESPDLTHIRTVSEGDDLHRMTYDIYGSDKHFLKIAAANRLTSPRNLTINQKLVFPPIEKTT